MDAANLGADALLDLVGHLGAALFQSDKITDPIVVDHLQSAHRLALDLYTSSGRTADVVPSTSESEEHSADCPGPAANLTTCCISAKHFARPSQRRSDAD
jgi:hypothetical protein